MDKREVINNLLLENKVDGFLLYSPQNRYWLSRFKSSLGYLLITKKGSYLFLDGRYITAARKSKLIQNVEELIPFSDDLWELINEKLEQDGVKNLGIESDWVRVSEAEGFKKALKTNIKPINTENIRIAKDQWEIEQIKKACDITNLVFQDVLSWVKPGISELELSRFVSDKFLEHGAQKLSFDTIVASGVNGDMPHAVPTSKIIKEGEFVTLDMGCYYNGYCSDQTRTFVMGNNYDPKMKEIYDTVLEAQQRGINAVKAGVPAKEIHNICMDYITSKGYEQYFTHGTGHGIGIEIHEEPYQSIAGNKILEPGMCITVEPGIYIPGLGGVRIEDDLLVTSDGYEFLTSAPRELQIVK